MKKSLAWILVAVFLISLAACGKQEVKSGNLDTVKMNPEKVVNTDSVGKIDHSAQETQPEQIADGMESVWVVTKKNTGNIVEYVYDDSMRVVSAVEKKGDQESRRFTYAYDENGNHTETVTIRDGEVTTRTVWNYDEQGRMLEQKSIRTSTGEPDYHFTYRYDENGNLIEQTEYDKDGEIRFVHSFTLDEANRISVQITRSSRGNEIDRYIYTYDAAGNITERMQYKEGDFYFLDEYTYDAHGNVTQWKYTNQNGETTIKTYTYTYTEQGKIAKETVTTNGTNTSFTQYIYMECRVPAEQISVIEENQKTIIGF